MVNFQRSGTDENRVYERLRKWSLRQRNKMVKAGNDPRLENEYHKYYLGGVYDALYHLTELRDPNKS